MGCDNGVAMADSYNGWDKKAILAPGCIAHHPIGALGPIHRHFEEVIQVRMNNLHFGYYRHGTTFWQYPLKRRGFQGDSEIRRQFCRQSFAWLSAKLPCHKKSPPRRTFLQHS
jgi:hypothetical protein